MGIIVPEETVLFEWARENGLELCIVKLCLNSQVKKLILEDMEQQAKAGDLKGFEKVNKYFIVCKLFLFFALIFFRTNERGFNNQKPN